MATARPGRDDAPEHAPEALDHAAPDVELAEAQLAVGRPDLADVDDDVAEEAERLTEDTNGDRADAGGSGAGLGGNDDGSGEDDDEDLSPVPAPGAAPARRPGLKLVHFLQGSWRELQRVQWPDRRQVMQATGVVIGFVIVAGAFLGLSDFVATKLVHFILQ